MKSTTVENDMRTLFDINMLEDLTAFDCPRNPLESVGYLEL